MRAELAGELADAEREVAAARHQAELAAGQAESKVTAEAELRLKAEHATERTQRRLDALVERLTREAERRARHEVAERVRERAAEVEREADAEAKRVREEAPAEARSEFAEPLATEQERVRLRPRSGLPPTPRRGCRPSRRGWSASWSPREPGRRRGPAPRPSAGVTSSPSSGARGRGRRAGGG